MARGLRCRKIFSPRLLVYGLILAGRTPSTSGIPAATTLSDVSSTPTDSATSAIISITALPPRDSASSLTRARAAAKKQSPGFDIVYLAPLFAILGALAGALCTWLLYRFVPARGKSLRREQSLEPGPRYTPPTLFRQATTALTVAAPETENLARPSESSAHPLLEAKPAEEKKGSWISRALSGRSRAAPTPTEQPSQPTDRTSGEAEDDPFLDASSASGTPSAGGGLGRQGTARTAFTQRLTSPDPYGALSDDEDAAPYETLRHKSIRRGILERLRLGSLRRPPVEYERGQTEDDDIADANASPTARRPTGKRRGHKRDSSDMSVPAMRSPMRTQSSEGTPSRRSTLSRNVSERATSSPGFRLVVEDPESGALLSAPPSRASSPTKSPTKEGGSWGWNLPWPSSPTKQRTGDDNLTALPVRRSLLDKRSSPYSSPSASRTVSSLDRSDDPAATRANMRTAPSQVPLSRLDSSILPASPPMVTSPPLESQLFFGAVSPNFGSSPSLNLRLPEAVEAKHSGHAHAPGAQHTTPGKEHKKLKTHRSPPPLPFPSTAKSSPFRGRLKKTPTKKASSAAASPCSSAYPSPRQVFDRNDSEDSVDPPHTDARGTPAQRHEARNSALSKVDEILSRSWTDRQMAGSGFPGSPTNFGAYLPAISSAGPSLEKLMDAEALNGAGIEQRLEALRKNGVS
ncbi:hypothetical protein OH77DRAFT_1504812 [Trametes cingulata]|nr:hypothetical protein OH77DRAFT_1504812 [Trametes cingulata]